MAPFFSLDGKIYEVITARPNYIVVEDIITKQGLTFNRDHVERNAKFGTIAYALVEPSGNYILSEMDPSDQDGPWKRVAVIEL